MADTKISDLTAATAVALTDTLPIVQSATTKEATFQMVADAMPELIAIAFSDETTAITSGTAKVSFHMPFAMTLTDVKVSLVTAGTGAVQATGTVTCATAIAGDTVTVNGLVYTAVAGARSNDTEFSIDTGNDETATDLAAAITADTRTGTDVAVVDQTATSASAVVTITAGAYGTASNSIGLASSDGATLAVSAATLTGGVNAFTVDLHEAGTTVLSTKITLDNTELTSATAITPPVISDSALAVDALMTVDVDSADAGGVSAGGKIYLIGTRA